MTVFRLPAEWEPHFRTWMIWPCRLDIWGDQIIAAEKSFESVIRAIAEYEPVSLIVTPQQEDRVSLRFNDLRHQVSIVSMEMDDSWARDVLPMFMTSNAGGLKALNWDFNAWGLKFDPYDKDRACGQSVIDTMTSSGELAHFENISTILEGGSVHFDGEGTLLTTKQCLLNKNRNPDLTQEDIESQLKQHFNIEKVIWLEEGLWGDVDTDGHVDVIAAFVKPGTIITMYSEDKSHPNYEIYKKNKAIIQASTDAKGRQIELIEIPQPMTVMWEDAPLPLSYINFYIVNGAVIVPVFDDPHDEKALSTFKSVFPNHDIIPINALSIFRGGGGIHCITMQQPKTY